MVNIPCILYRGWPVPAELEKALKAGKITVSVFPVAGMERNTTRFNTDLNALPVSPATVTATIAGQTITFAGTLPYAQNVGVRLGSTSGFQKTYTYGATTSDSPSTIAAGIAALMVADGVPATAAGAVLTLPSTAVAYAVVGTSGNAWQELKRQERGITITTWCNTPAQRDLVAPLVDQALAATSHLLLSDGSGATMKYGRSGSFDERQTVEIYRRDFIYMVEYATTRFVTAPQIIATNAGVTGSF